MLLNTKFKKNPTLFWNGIQVSSSFVLDSPQLPTADFCLATQDLIPGVAAGVISSTLKESVCQCSA